MQLTLIMRGWGSVSPVVLHTHTLAESGACLSNYSAGISCTCSAVQEIMWAVLLQLE